MKDIKKKVKAKVAKGKAKVSRKCGRARKVVSTTAVLIFAALVALFAGCQNPAQRAQTSRISDNTITINITADYPAELPRKMAAINIEIGSQAQANETRGDDAGLTTTTPTTVSPNLDLSIPVNKANAGTSAAGGALESVVGALGDKAASAIRGKSTSATTPNAAECSDCTTGTKRE